MKSSKMEIDREYRDYYNKGKLFDCHNHTWHSHDSQCSPEMLCRYEENASLLSILRHFGHPAVLYELSGFDHGTVLGPACMLIRDDIRKDSGK